MEFPCPWIPRRFKWVLERHVDCGDDFSGAELRVAGLRDMELLGDGLEVVESFGDEDGVVFFGVHGAERRVARWVAREEVD